MKIWQWILGVMVLLGILMPLTPVAYAAPSDLVYVVDVDGSIDRGLARYIEKSLTNAVQDEIKAVIFRINTFGGLVEAATQIRDDIVDSPVMTVALITERAWSAGALISLACDRIYMAPESSMGAAETRPKEEKFISAFRKEFKATAEKQGRDPDVAASMVDADIAIPGVIEKGKLLTLTAKEAVELGMADGRFSTVQEILPLIKAEGAVVKELEPSSTDRFGRFVSSYAVSTLLVTIGFIGLIVEAVTLGWGVGGSIGILSMAVFFGGNLLVGNTSWGLILLFIGGIILLGLELFVVPGFGITGLAGIGLVVVSLFLTFESPVVGMYAISFSLLVGVVALILAFKYFETSKAWNRIALNMSQTKEKGYSVPTMKAELIGLEGEALSTLRPAGTALIQGERLDVVSEGGYIIKGSLIKVVKVEGTKVVVREI